VAQEWFWPSLPWVANLAVPASVSASLLTAILFAQAFLDLRRRFPRWNKVLQVQAVLSAAGILGAVLLPYGVVIRYVTALAVVICMMMVLLAVIAWRTRYRPARYYAASWTVFFIGITIYALNKFGVLPLTFLTKHIHEIGFALKALLLSLALADRINLIRQEKDRAQAQTLELQRRTAADLEREVELKTQDLSLRTREAERASAEAISATAEAEEARQQAEEARQQAEQTKGQLEKAYEQLSELAELKSQFFANVSHELRTPLTLILTPVERMIEERSDLPGEHVARLRSVVHNTHRLLRLVNQLLDLSRLEAGATRVTFQRCDVRALTEEIVAIFQPLATSKELTLVLRGPDTLPELYINPGRYDEVLGNLLSNACKFTAPGGTVVVRLV
jgi:signal transduction histidine kinase